VFLDLEALERLDCLADEWFLQVRWVQSSLARQLVLRVQLVQVRPEDLEDRWHRFRLRYPITLED
jgi:hypothetical protein